MVLKGEKTRPLLKWTGGKYDECKEFKHLIPSFERYIEPFCGAGGVFFALQPTGPSYLNDISTPLINFCNLIPSLKFQKELWIYVEAWDKTAVLSSDIFAYLKGELSHYLSNRGEEIRLSKYIRIALSTMDLIKYTPLFDDAFIGMKDAFMRRIGNSIIAKCRKAQHRNEKEYSSQVIEKIIETAIKGAFYEHLRFIMNDNHEGQNTMSNEKAIANWYFVRELCYASMFRFNKKGLFNIPYGGMSYNRKNMREKVHRVCSDKIQGILSNTIFSNEDFEVFLNNCHPSEKDFVFVDPPYDSPFCKYDNHAFTHTDHKRLYNALAHLPGKWLLVIRETPFIQSLYSKKQFRIKQFRKSYSHNIKGRHRRSATHLLIMNYGIL